MVAFNLVDSPWIPVVAPDGTVDRVGLREALVTAHQIASVQHASPLVTVMLHRLMLAILHRVFGPADPEEWVQLWRRGAWPPESLHQYLNQWRDRFNLFDPERPFYQVPYMNDAVVHKPEYLMLEAASGNNATLFDHHHEKRLTTMAPAEAACYLLAQQGYAIGFGKSSPFYFADAPLVRGFSVLVHGGNLFETLALNMIQYRPTSSDLPIWEQDAAREPEHAGTVPRGYLDYLTWPSRRIHLIAGGNADAVVSCQIQQNLKLRGEDLDPFKAFRADKKRGLVPISLTPGRAAWRNADALFHLPDATRLGTRDESVIAPGVFRWLSVVRRQARSMGIELRPVYRFGVYGMATQPGKAASVVLWSQEELPLPLDLLDDPRRVHHLAEGLQLAERVASLERQAARRLASVLLAPATDTKAGRAADPREVQDLAEHWDPTASYWATLGQGFASFMIGLSTEPTTALEKWGSTVRDSAVESFGRLVQSLGNSARELKAIVSGERAFRVWLGRELSEWKERTGSESAEPA